jgi:hypothetical protein
MWYDRGYANSSYYPTIDRRRTPANPNGAAFERCLFNTQGLAVLQEGSSRPHQLRTTFPDEALEALQDLLHRSPRDFGLATSVWTLSLAARLSFQQGLTPRLVSGESVRRALKRLATSWKRAKHWITSPDPQYLLKKTTAAILAEAFRTKAKICRCSSRERRKETPGRFKSGERIT